MKWRRDMRRQGRSSQGPPTKAYPQWYVEETEHSEGRRWQAEHAGLFCRQTTSDHLSFWDKWREGESGWTNSYNLAGSKRTWRPLTCVSSTARWFSRDRAACSTSRAAGSGGIREHIPGSVHVDLMTELADQTAELLFTMPPTEQFVSVMESVGVGDGTRVVLYDFDINMWAARVWWMLHSVGFDEAGILDGGLRRWKAEGRSVTADPAPRHPRAAFALRPRPGIFVGKEEVLAAIEDDDITIVDALPAASLQRREPSTTPVAATSRPQSTYRPVPSLIATHTPTPTPTNCAAWRPPHSMSSPAQTITYCGGGISAASTAFALSLLGAEQVSIYDGSMGEWTRDPSLPLEVPPAG